MDTPFTTNAINVLLGMSIEMQPFLQIVALAIVHFVQSATPQYHASIYVGTHLQHTILPTKFNKHVSIEELQM